MVLSLHDKLSKIKLKKGRDHLMWVLLQFISGSIQKSALSAFSPVMKLFDLLYPETEPLPVPSEITPESTVSFSMACVWVHLSRKAKSDNLNMHKVPPKPLVKLLDYLYQKLQVRVYSGHLLPTISDLSFFTSWNCFVELSRTICGPIFIFRGRNEKLLMLK